MKRLGAIAASLLGLIVILSVVACSGGSDSSQDVGSAGSSTSGPALRLVGSDPLTLDPALVTDAVSASYVVEIYSGLVTIDKDLKIAPDIARTWDVSPDGKTYTFHLRDDVVFQTTYRQVTASDFKYSIERAANPKTASTVAQAYLGDIVGVTEMLGGTADSVSGIEAVDNFTLRITIDEAKPYFLAKLACPTAFVVGQDPGRGATSATGRRSRTAPAPFRSRSGSSARASPSRPTSAIMPACPAVSTVNFVLSGGSRLTMYEDDEVDVAGVSIADIDRVLDTNDPLHSEYLSADQMSINYLGFNTQKPPFDDPKVRQAFGMADRPRARLSRWC